MTLPMQAEHLTNDSAPKGLKRWLGWVSVAITAITAANVAADYNRINLPGASPSLFWICLLVAAACMIVLSPIVFSRLPLWGRAGGVLLFLVLVSIAGNERETAFQAFLRTRAGQQAQAEADSKAKQAYAATEKANKTLAEEAAKKTAAERDEKLADLEAQKPEACIALVTQVVDGVNILEINNVVAETSYLPHEVLTCSGDAITRAGGKKIEFGLAQTPQGKSLVAIRYL